MASSCSSPTRSSRTRPVRDLNQRSLDEHEAVSTWSAAREKRLAGEPATRNLNAIGKLANLGHGLSTGSYPGPGGNDYGPNNDWLIVEDDFHVIGLTAGIPKIAIP